MSDHFMKKANMGHQRKISATTEFKDMTKRDSQSLVAAELEKLLLTANPMEKDKLALEFKGFQRHFQKFVQGSGPSVSWEKIDPLPQDAVRDYSSLNAPEPSQIKQMLNKLVVVKLNGGLGTSMGCVGPKSVIPVRNDLTFLDLTVAQIEHLNKEYDSDVPLVLMNSFNTDEDTQKVLRKYKGFRVKIYTFMQSRYPRINKESLLPIAKTAGLEDPEAWYPPGHGDFYEAFSNSGLLQFFINEGQYSRNMSPNLITLLTLGILYCFFVRSRVLFCL